MNTASLSQLPPPATPYALAARADASALPGWSAPTAALPSSPAWRRPPSLPAPEVLAVALDQLDTGVLVVDAKGQVLHHNSAAKVEMLQGGVLHIGSDGAIAVAAEAGADLAVLHAALAAATGEHLRQLVVLRAGSRRLALAVQPLHLAGHAPLAMLLLQRRQLCPGVVIEMLATHHALTLTERRVLAGLVEGRRIADIAQAHGVRVCTVRTQVAALRQKLGVRRLDDLTRLAAELPPMAPVLHTLWPAPVASYSPIPAHRRPGPANAGSPAAARAVG